MKAIVYKNYGGPEVFELNETPMPEPKDDEVRVRVQAVSINDWDWALMKGDNVNRMINGFKKPKINILGSDIAGIVESTGSKATKFRPGDEVYGDLSGRWGGFAEYVCAQENKLAIKPASMSFVEAAALPQAGMLAIQGLLEYGKLKQAERVLFNGAGGGVGTIGMQIAKISGAHCTGVDNSYKQEKMLKLGFDEVLDYTKEDFTKKKERYDLVIDVKTNRSPHHYTRVLNRGGRYVTAGGSIARLLQTFVSMPVNNLFTNKRIRIVNLKTNRDLALLNEMYESGRLKPVIDGPFLLEDFRSAFDRYGSMKHFGKVVMKMQ